MKVTALLHDCSLEGETGFAASCVEFPEANGQGENVEACIEDLRAAVNEVKKFTAKLSIRAGDRLEFVLEPHGRVTLSKKKTPGASAGCGKRFVSGGKSVPTVERMDEGIREALVKRFGGPGFFEN